MSSRFSIYKFPQNTTKSSFIQHRTPFFKLACQSREKEQTKNLDDWEKDRLGKLYKESSSRVKNQDIDLDK